MKSTTIDKQLLESVLNTLIGALLVLACAGIAYKVGVYVVPNAIPGEALSSVGIVARCIIGFATIIIPCLIGIVCYYVGRFVRARI